MYKYFKKLVSVGILTAFAAVTIFPLFDGNNYANDPAPVAAKASVKPLTTMLADYQFDVYNQQFIKKVDTVPAETIFVDCEEIIPEEEYIQDEIEVAVFEANEDQQPNTIKLQSIMSSRFSFEESNPISLDEVSSNDVSNDTEEEIVETQEVEETTEEVAEEIVEETKEETTTIEVEVKPEAENEPILAAAKPTKQKTEEKTKKAKDSDKTIYDVLPLSESVIDAIIESCDKNDIPILNAIGIIDLESQFNTEAKSWSGCYGLCQLNPSYFPKNLSPEDNVRYGIDYLAGHYHTYKDWTKAYNAYNAGHVNGDTKYANKVFSLIDKWKKEFDKAGIEY